MTITKTQAISTSLLSQTQCFIFIACQHGYKLVSCSLSNSFNLLYKQKKGGEVKRTKKLGLSLSFLLRNKANFLYFSLVELNYMATLDQSVAKVHKNTISNLDQS